jgi:hypothetical protein
MGPCDSEAESPGRYEVWFEGTNPTCCSSSGWSETAPELKLVIHENVYVYTGEMILMYLPDQSERWMSPSTLSNF